MDILEFEWNAEKNKGNRNKHGITFEMAKTVFYDNNALLLDDPDHSDEEDRFLMLGLNEAGELCIVSHCYRKKGKSIRIISARKATKKEQNDYVRWNKG